MIPCLQSGFRAVAPSPVAMESSQIPHNQALFSLSASLQLQLYFMKPVS